MDNDALQLTPAEAARVAAVAERDRTKSIDMGLILGHVLLDTPENIWARKLVLEWREESE